MQGWFCDNPVGVQALQWREAPTPEPREGQVRIVVRAASLNFPDLLTVQNKYQFKPELPFVPGSELAGEVEAVGPGVTWLKPGDRVAALGSSGGFATHACVDATRTLPLPPTMGFEEGAAYGLTYGTSHHALLDRGALKAGETVLILGAAGGVGTSAIQIAKAAGAKVIAGVSSDDKAAFCTALGADATINYATQDLREALKSLTQGRGPDVVYDPVGGDLAEPAFRSIAWRGRFLVVGFALGTIPALPLNLALLKGASIVGVFWGDFVRREPKASAQAFAQLAQWYGEGRIKPVIDQVLPMSRVHDAYERMGSRRAMGKIVLVNAP